MLEALRLSDGYAIGRDVVETMDVEGCGRIAGDDDVGVAESPFQPDVEEMSLDPAIAVLGILEEFELVDFEDRFAGVAVCVSSNGFEICHNQEVVCVDFGIRMSVPSLQIYKFCANVYIL